MFFALIKTDDSPSQFLIRLVLGLVLFPPAARNTLGWFGGPGYTATVTLFSGMGFPLWLIIAMIVIELAGAVLLLSGCLTRIWALTVGASILIHLRTDTLATGWLSSWFDLKQGSPLAFHLLALGTSLALLIGGGGSFSLDRALTKGRRRSRISF